jgi:HK97 family phage major capsid protein
MNTRQLLEKRAKLVAQLRDMQDAADTAADGAMTPEQTAAFEAVKAALAQLEDALSRRSLIEEAERRASGTPVGGTGDRNLDREMRNFSIVRALASGAGLDVDAAREREISQEIARRAGRTFNGIAVPLAVLRRQVEQRVVTTTTPSGTPGGSLIQTTVDGEQYIDLLRAALRIRQLGARYITGLTGNVDVPRLAQTASAGWVAENTPLTASDEGFDKVSLRPHHAGALVEFSRNMLQQSVAPGIEDLVRADLAAGLARVLDAAAIKGTGAANDPTGILNTSGIGSVAMGTNGGAITWPAVLGLVESIEVGNVGDDARAFLGNPKVKASAMQTPKVAGVALGFVMDEPDELAGYDYASTNLIPANGTKGTGTGLSTLIYGNWSDLLIGVWSELDILVNPFESTAYAKGNVQVRAMMTCDVQLRHPQSFAAITDIVAA